MNHTPRLEDALHRTHALKRFTDTAAAIGKTFAFVLAAALIAVLLDAVVAFDSSGLIAVDVLLGLLACGAIFWVARNGWRNRFSARRTARLVEERLSLHDSRYINALDLATDGREPTSVSLRELAVQRGDTQASAIRATAVVDREPLRKALFTAAGASLVILISLLLAPRLFGMVLPRYFNPTADLPPFTLLRFEVTTEPEKIYAGKTATIRVRLSGPTLPDSAEVVLTDEPQRTRLTMLKEEAGVFILPIERAERSRTFFIDTPYGRSYSHNLTVLPVPLFESVSVRYDYPAYTGWPSVERALDAGGIRAILGTRATVTIKSNLPLRKGKATVVFDEKKAAPLISTFNPDTATPSTVSGSLELLRSGKYSITLAARDGTPSEKPFEGPIVVTSDQPPSVQLLAPDLRVAVPEGWKVPINVTASDDIGVKKLVLHHRVNDKDAGQSELPLNQPRPSYASGAAQLDLAQIGAKAGDVVKGFATAFDNRPDPAQSADSPSFEIRVLTEEQYKELARQEYAMKELLAELEKFQAEQAKLEETRDKLIEELEALKKKAEENGGQLGEEDQKKAEELQKQLEEYAKQTQELADKMNERANRMSLYDFEPGMQKQLKEAAQKMGQQAGASKQSAAALSDPSQQNIDKALEQLKKDKQAAGQDEQQRELTEKQLRQIELADRMNAEADAVMDIAQRQKELAERLSTYQNSSQTLNADDRARLAQLAQEQQELQKELNESLQRLEQAAKDGAADLPKMSGSSGELVEKIRNELKIEDDQAHAAESALASRGSQAHKSADSAATKLASLIKECNGMCNSASDDLDGALGMTKSQIQNALKQLAGARSGNGQGSGGGQGIGAGRGAGLGPAGNQAGGAANGATLLGPHSRQNLSGRPTAKVRLRTGTVNTLNQGPDSAGDVATQTLDPQSDNLRRDAAGGPPDTPLPYRKLSEQYFRRLAEDTK